MLLPTTYNNTTNSSSRRSNSAFSYAVFSSFHASDSTSKETDCETGFSYFGARYYDPTLLTSWTAVDPMADKYPSLSPYNYCAWNPMKLVDPDGREYSPIYDPNGVFLGCTSEGFSGNVYICLGTPPSCLKEDWSAMNEDDLLDDPDGSYVFVTFNSAGLSNGKQHHRN